MITVAVRRALSADETTDVLDLVARITRADDLAPLSEHVLLHLRHGGDVQDEHVLASIDGVLVGYAHLDTTDVVNGPSGEVAVDPAHRRVGVARALVNAMIAACPEGRMRLWAHGENSGARALAESLGLHRTRVLWQMRRSLRLPLPDAPLPDGVTVRAFRPGVDDTDWLAVNQRAFREHPEQGAWTQVDLDRRIAEPWFDPAGFLLADEAGRLVGCHWTKVHGHHETHHDDHHHGHEPIGEVYVLCVDPGYSGRGLGRALTVAGLAYLRDLGLTEAMLYVDADNHTAIGLYESLGFTRWDTDVEFSSPSSS